MVSAPEHLPESDLATMAAAGDERAFTELFERFYPAIRGFAARSLLDPSEADDIAQETFIRAGSTIGSLRNGNSFRAWIFRIATNLTKDALRARAARSRKLDAYANESIPKTSTEHDGADRVAAALSSLPPDQRMAVVLVYHEDHTHAEAARALGCAETTVSWRIMLAKRALRKFLSR